MFIKTMDKKGQIGPQGLEDVPLSLMAFMTAIAFMILFFTIVSSRLTEAQVDDMHKTGKRLAEQLGGEIFKSERSASYGANVLDASLIDLTESSDKTLAGRVGALEYSFWARISAGPKQWEFGVSPPETTLAYGLPLTVLFEDFLEDGEVVVKIWRT